MNDMLTIEQYVASLAQQVEQALASIVPAEWTLPGPLREAMDYSLRAGGKRLRPVLTLAAAEAVTGELRTDKTALQVACALELIHTYSLIHDDLPAMDDDDYRRGKPTNHKVFGEAMAILAGDALLTHAFYCVSAAAAGSKAQGQGLKPEAALAIVRELATYAGAPGMVGGQAADMLGEQGATTLEQLEYIHLHKTSDLIACALRAGGWLADATAMQLDALGRFGHQLGLAFQIQDDILDLIGDADKLGKPVNSDVVQDKVTYPYLLGLEASRQEVARLTTEAKDALLSAGLAKPGRLLALAELLMARDR